MRQERVAWPVTTLFGVACLAVSCSGPSDKELRGSIEASLAGSSKRGTASLNDFYKERGFTPVWIDRNGLDERGASLLRAVCAAEELGLHPADYEPNGLRDLLRTALEASAREQKVKRLAELELALSRTLVEMVSDARAGRLNLPRLQENWHYKVGPRAVRAREVLGLFSQSADLRAALQSERAGEDAGAMVEALAAYRRIADKGGWKSVPAGPTLRTGSSGARVAAVRARLQVTGDSPAARVGSSTRFDAALEEAARRFQRRHGLEPNGEIDEASRRAMNVPVEDRISQLELNLERERWLPDRKGQDHILVNVPEFMLHAYRGGEEALSMRVIVGKSMNQTPIFADEITYVVFRPYWNVPQSIAEEEILPAQREDPDYLVENGYTIVDSDGNPVGPPGSATRAAAAAGPALPSRPRSHPVGLDEEAIAEGRHRIRQEPGPSNALGLIKFMFPNDFDIYLHDTPADRLFAEHDRAFSHGCIRVKDPVRLAEHLLAANGDWSSSRIRSQMQDPQVVNELVGLKRKSPVYIVYLTAWVDDQGSVQFREDVYEQDRRLRAAIEESGGGRADRSACEEIDGLLSQHGG